LVPMIGNSRATDKANGAVDHHQLAVGTIVVMGNGVPAYGVIPRELAAGFLQIVEISVLGAHAAEAVDHDFYGHSGTRAFRERLHKAPGDLALLEDVGFDVDVLLGLTDG